MPQVIRSTQTKIITKNGETELSISIEPIVIEVTINVNHDGTARVGEVVKTQSVPEDEPKVLVAQEFGKNAFGAGKIKFGKNIGE